MAHLPPDPYPDIELDGSQGFYVRTEFVATLGEGLKAHEAPVSSANATLKNIYNQVLADGGSSFDTPNHWGLVTNNLSDASHALDGLTQEFTNLVSAISQTAQGYYDGEQAFRKGFNDGRNKLPVIPTE